MTAKLTAKERTDLRAILQDAFPTYDELDMFLDTFDRKLSLIAAPDGMDIVVFKVVRQATDRGWLPELLDNALAEQGDDPVLLAMARRLGVKAMPAGPAAYKLGDLTHFDLTDIERKFRDVRIACEGTKLVLAAVDCQEAMFLDSLQRRIEQIVRVTARPRIQVDGASWTVARALRELESYAETLNDLAVFCPVSVLSSAGDVEALATGVARSFTSPANELVLILFIRSGWAVPAAVEALPSPVPRPADVDTWVESIADELNWEDAIRRQVRSRILAAVAASDVPVYEVYKQLQGEIDRLRLAKPPAA